MRGDDSSYRRRQTFEPRATIVDLPSPAPLGRGPGSDGRSRLIVALLAVFVVAALLKPWEAPQDQGPPPKASPTAGKATPRPAATQPPAPPIDWSLAAPVIERHDTWGLRALVLENGALATTVSTTGVASGSNLHAAEVWTAATPNDPGPHAPVPTEVTVPGQIVSDAVLLRTQGAPVAAIGVTSPDAQPVIDVRVWRIVSGQAIRIDARDLPGSAPGVDRLLVPPPGLDPAGLWPPGLYHIDLLVRQKVLNITVLLPPLLHDTAQIARITDLAVDLAPGPFVVKTAKPGSGLDYVVNPIATASVAQLGVAAAWLQLGTQSPSADAPDAGSIATDSSIVALGLRGALGEKLSSTVLVNLAPSTPRTLSGLVIDTPASDIVIYELGAEGLAAGVYRIDSSWFKDGVGHERSLYLDVHGPDAPSHANAPFLVAARQWAKYAGQSVVLAYGSPPTAELPNRVLPDVTQLRETCPGAALVDDRQQIIGIGYTGPGPRSISVEQLYSGGQTVQVPAAIAADTVPGLVLMADTSSQTWQPGYYQAVFDRSSGPDRVVFCVGRANSDGIVRVPTDAATPPGPGGVVTP
jgi:hypothetical protein